MGPLKHLAEARAVLSTWSNKLVYRQGSQAAPAALVNVPAAASVTADDFRAGQKESQTPPVSRNAKGKSAGAAPVLPVIRLEVLARLEVSEVEFGEVKVLPPVVVGVSIGEDSL